MLVEAVAAMALLSVAGLVLFKGAINVLAPRQWTLVQNITDAYMTYEKAYAERIEFDEAVGAGSPWPSYPSSSSTNVTLGTLPGGRTLTGEVIRTRMADSNNLSQHGGGGTTSTNPAELQSWKLQSHLLYRIGGREYVKSRTVVRTQ